MKVTVVCTGTVYQAEMSYVIRFEKKGVTWSEKSFLILLDKGYVINFKVVKTDILGPSYGCLKFIVVFTAVIFYY